MLKLLLFAIFPIFIAVPVLIYHFLVFPNVDGVAQDLSWYNYDDSSQHFLYWLGFWSSAIIGGILGGSIKNGN